jgi:hypothetical protein
LLSSRSIPLPTWVNFRCRLLTFSAWIRGARCYQPAIRFLRYQSWLFQQADHLSPDDLIEELLPDEADSASVRSAAGSTPNAYQEELLSIDPLPERMPVLRQGQQTLGAELQAIADQTNDRARFLRLTETFTAFLARLRSAAETLSVIERQKIVRLLVKRFWSAKIPLRFVTAFCFLRVRLDENQSPRTVNITFCVGA